MTLQSIERIHLDLRVKLILPLRLDLYTAEYQQMVSGNAKFAKVTS